MSLIEYSSAWREYWAEVRPTVLSSSVWNHSRLDLGIGHHSIISSRGGVFFGDFKRLYYRSRLSTNSRQLFDLGM